MSAAAPLSALAARRLRSQEATPAPKTPEKSHPGALATSSDSESAEDLAAKRREIEAKLKVKFKAQRRGHASAKYRNASLEEPVLARVRGGVGEVLDAAAGTDDDMVDVSELIELRSDDEGGEEEIQAQVNLSYSEERFATWGFNRLRKGSRILIVFVSVGVVQAQRSRRSRVSFLPNRTTAKSQIEILSFV